MTHPCHESAPTSCVMYIDPPRRPRKPTKDDQLAMLKFEIDTLRDSFSIRIGVNKGKIEDKYVLWELQCLEAALDTIQRS